jgi:hypothetical protein
VKARTRRIEKTLDVRQGFKSLVDAEPGPMGAGAGAAAAIDKLELSPRGAAIEKAQAELRCSLRTNLFSTQFGSSLSAM